MAKQEDIKVAREWWSTGGRIPLTDEQKQRKKKTGSYYRRDEQVHKYTFSNGEGV